LIYILIIYFSANKRHKIILGTHCRPKTSLKSANALISPRLDKDVARILVDFLKPTLRKFALKLHTCLGDLSRVGKGDLSLTVNSYTLTDCK
jgi:hypothetical protein